jgi:hypothetical protein
MTTTGPSPGEPPAGFAARVERATEAPEVSAQFITIVPFTTAGACYKR